MHGLEVGGVSGFRLSDHPAMELFVSGLIPPAQNHGAADRVESVKESLG